MLKTALALSTFLVVTSAAQASFIKADVADTKIFFNNDAADGHHFTGNVDQNNTGPLVNFVGQDKVDPKNGFSTIKPLEIDGNGDFVSLLITPTETTWSAFTFRGQLDPTGFTGIVKLLVTDQFGNHDQFTFSGLDGPSTDFGDIGIKSIDDERITSLQILADGGESFKELKQFEVQRKEAGCVGADCPVINPTGNDVPEPYSIAILGMGLIGLGTIRKMFRA